MSRTITISREYGSGGGISGGIVATRLNWKLVDDCMVAELARAANVDPNVVRMCRSLTATDWQIFLSVRFPFALPYVFNGLKIGVTMAMIGVIVAQGMPPRR